MKREIKVTIDWASGSQTYEGIEQVASVSYNSKELYAGSVSNVSVKLFGDFKNLWETEDFGNVVATLEIFVDGVPDTLLRGIIADDVVFDPLANSISFTIREDAKSVMLGTLADKTWVNANARDKMIPMVFGRDLNVKAVQLTGVKGITLVSDARYMDSTFKLSNPESLPSTTFKISLNGIIFEGSVDNSTGVFTVTNRDIPAYTDLALKARPIDDTYEFDRRVAWLDSSYDLNMMFVLLKDENNQKYVNHVSVQFGDRLTFIEKCHKLLDENDTILEAAYTPLSTWPDFPGAVPDAFFKAGIDVGILIPFSYAVDDSTDNTLGAIHGYTEDGNLQPVPSSLYTIEYKEGWTLVTFQSPLSSRMCEKWTDEIVVSVYDTRSQPFLESHIVRILNQVPWITDVNLIGFDLYRASGFTLYTVFDAIKMAQTLAWEALGTLFIANGVATLRDITKTTPVFAFNESNVEASGLQESVLGYSDIYTRLVAELPSGEKYTYENNIDKYGVREKSVNIYGYTNMESVKTVIDFWGYIYSHKWRQVSLNSFFEDTLTAVLPLSWSTLTIPQVNPATIKAFALDVSFDSVEARSSFKLLTAVEEGSLTEDPDFWTIHGSFGLDPMDAPSDTQPVVDRSCLEASLGGSTIQPVPKWYIKCVVAEQSAFLKGVPILFDGLIVDEDGNTQDYNGNLKIIVHSSNISDKLFVRQFFNNNPVEQLDVQSGWFQFDMLVLNKSTYRIFPSTLKIRIQAIRGTANDPNYRRIQPLSLTLGGLL